MFEYFAVKQFSQGITGFFVDSLFNFQGSERSARFRASLFIVSHPLRFVKYFFRFFSKSFSFLTAPRLRQPYYCITSSSLCQELFHLFSRFFSFPLRSGRLPAPALFPLSGGFLRFFGAVSLRQLCYSITPASQCQAFFSVF